MQFTNLKQFVRTQRGAATIAVAPGLLASVTFVAGAGMVAASTQNVAYGLAALVGDVLVVMPATLLGVYLPTAVLLGRRLLPGERPTTERLVRVFGAAGVFGFILGGSCGWISLGGYGLLPVHWAGSWPVRIGLVALVWAAVAVFATVRITEAGLKATAPKRRRKPAVKKAAAQRSAKTAVRKRAATQNLTDVSTGNATSTVAV